MSLQSKSGFIFGLGLCLLTSAALVLPAAGQATGGQNAPAAGPQSASTASPQNVNAAPRAKATTAAKPQTAAKTEDDKKKIKEPVTAAGCKSALAPGKPYFVEFRSRTAASYGHTFVFYGRLGSGNKFANFSVAGLHPAGDDASTYLMGHMVPVAAETGVSYGDLDEQYLTARFCVTLNEADFKKVSAYIKQLQGEHKTWHATTYNCNAFAADIAKSIKLDTPNPNMYLPDVFIKRLGELNGAKKDTALRELPNR